MKDGYESFESDFNIFSNKISLLMESRNKEEIINIVNEKHKSEVIDDVDKDHKRDDLIIWNAVFTREIIRNGISKKYLHPIYNKFYRKIKEANSISSLQMIETKMINEYMDLLINDTEITDSFTVNKLLQALHLNIENHTSLETICNNLNISVGYASTCFKKHKGISIMKYLREIKIERAKTLLLSTEKSILEISILLGFHDQSHFTNTFKKIVGISPSEFRNKNYSI
ncbi:helix-turn-helix domain-containing protein [Clostridium sp. MB05]|uniref:helix-turn-helix domain-containing protein n=1 Tax=Clostridium sp. MB05 TaxID=3376682 RepID=UPI0039829D2D